MQFFVFAYICMIPTLRASGACSLHTTYSNTLLNIKGNYPSPQRMDLSEFLNQRNGLWTRQIPQGLISQPLPGTPCRIRPLIPTFRFPLIWSWHRGDGLLCISSSQDGELFTWSPPDWIWSVALLLHYPMELRLEFIFFFFRGYLLHYHGWNIIHSGTFTIALRCVSSKAWWIRVADITSLCLVPLTKAKFLLWMWQQRQIDRPPKKKITLLYKCEEHQWTVLHFNPWRQNPHVNVSVMNVAYRRCIILFLLHLFLNIKWIW